jgi:hypothetical protein
VEKTSAARDAAIIVRTTPKDMTAHVQCGARL